MPSLSAKELTTDLLIRYGLSRSWSARILGWASPGPYVRGQSDRRWLSSGRALDPAFRSSW